ncbi:hypothetical protein [Actinoplanes sp. NPDC049118]|uniref:hypothetical protein n=1 Tax=Actinoplanes sp. NPDC049118 TaxID=3155769 RepID=UPI00340CF765
MFDYPGPVEWRTQWRITIRWDHADNSPVGAVTLERDCRTPAELRFILGRARSDEHVVAFPYRQVRVLVGDEPQQCRAGHTYRGGSATRPARDWWPCACGGHLVIRCVCGDVMVTPVVGDDCNARAR